MAQYGLLVPGNRARRVLDQHNATFRLIDRLARNERRGWMRLILQREARAFVRYEAAHGAPPESLDALRAWTKNGGSDD